MTTVADRRLTFDSLWCAHADAVFGFARRRVDEQGARDALAETFTVAWRRLEEVPAEPLPWLLGVCRKVLANQRRGDGRRRDLLARLAGLAPVAQPDAAERSAEAAHVREAFRALGRRDRETLALVAWDGLSPAEAAVVCGCSAGTFTTRLHRARTRLAERLASGETAPATPPATEEAP
jgi:RNA polymerase sigma-70 factor (ECF subfamily)